MTTSFLFQSRPPAVSIWRCVSCDFRFVSSADLVDSNEPYDSPEIAAYRALDHDRALRRARSCVATLKRYVTGGALLDVGCGGGELLEVARQSGFDRCYGVEPAAWMQDKLDAARQTDGILIHHGELDSAKLPDAHLDAAVMIHATEHVAEPVALMNEIRRVLKPGGFVLLVTPNVDAWPVRWQGPRSGFYFRGHTSHYSPKTHRR